MSSVGSQNGHYSHVVEEKLFKLLLHLEVQKAVRLQYCVSVLCLTPDAPGSLDAATAEQLAESAVRQLRGTDVATTFSTGSAVGLLLVDADTRTLQQILDRTREAAQAIPGGEYPVSLSAGASCYPETATTGRDLLRQATDLMARAKAEGGNRLCLPS